MQRSKTQLASPEPFSKEASYGKRRKVIIFLHIACHDKISRIFTA